MTDTSNKKRAKVLAPLAGVLTSLLHVSGSETDAPGPRYWTGESNIVATVSAYERVTRLPTGETVPYFSTEIDGMCTNYTAIVFYVLSPPECAGKYFRLEAIQPEPLSGSLPLAYYFGKLYYFGMSRSRAPKDGLPSADHGEDPYSWFWGIAPDDLATFPVPTPGRMNIGKTTGTIYYTTIKEANEALNVLEKKRREMEKEIKELSVEVEQIKRKKSVDYKKDTDYRLKNGRLSNLKRIGLLYNGNRQKEARMQIGQLERLESDTQK